MFACLKGKRHENNQTFFLKNGGALLEELVAFCDGRSNPIRHFSEEELLSATNYYADNQIIVFDSYRLYKGSLKERPILVKQYVTDFSSPLTEHFAYRDIAIGSQMSAHKNVMKVIGCCLETPKPSVVYEFTGKQILSDRITATNVESVLLPWKCRLRIAVDLANVVTYLHTAFSRPVVHRDIRCSSILLDHNNVPKLIDFGLCISIPQGQSHVEDAVFGRMGYGAPEYMASGFLTEKADVYHFGMLLLELLSGRKAIEVVTRHEMMHDDDKHRVEIFSEAVDPRISTEEEQLQVLATLFARCTCKDGVKRPAMMEVAKELKQILQSCL